MESAEDISDTHVFEFCLAHGRLGGRIARVEARVTDTVGRMRQLLWQRYGIPRKAPWTFSVPVNGGWKSRLSPKDDEPLSTIRHVRKPISIFRRPDPGWTEGMELDEDVESGFCGTEILEEQIEVLPLTFTLTEADFADAAPEQDGAAEEGEEEDQPEMASSDDSAEADRAFLDEIAAAGPPTWNDDDIEVMGLTFVNVSSDESDDEEESSLWKSLPEIRARPSRPAEYGGSTASSENSDDEADDAFS
jgi:hypothetical protein